MSERVHSSAINFVVRSEKAVAGTEATQVTKSEPRRTLRTAGKPACYGSKPDD